MWVFFEGGFVSIVEDTQAPDGDTLLVRARARDDVLAFCRFAQARPGVISTPQSDYRYRARLPRAAVARGCAAIAMGVRYPNFKSRVAATQGVERAHVYSDVWAAALPIDERYRAARVKPGRRKP